MKSRSILLTAIILCLLMLTCGEDNPSAPGTDPDTTPPDNPDLVSEDIGPDGGEITSKDGKLTLNIPEGALSGTETITIEAIETDDLGSEFDEIEAENAWELGPDGLTFDQAITVAYQVEANEDGNSLEVTMPGLLTESDGDAVALDSLVFEGGTLTGELDHFTPIVVDNNFATATVRNVPDLLEVGDSVMVEVEVRINSGIFGESFVNPPSGGDGKVAYVDFEREVFSAGALIFENLTPSFDDGVERFDGSFKYTCVTKGQGEYGASIRGSQRPADRIFIVRIPEFRTKLVLCVQPNTAPTIESVEGRLTSPSGTKYFVSGEFKGDVADLSALFFPDDGNEDIVIEPEKSAEIEDGWNAIIDHILKPDAMFPINPKITVENTQTGESDSESFEVESFTATVKKDGEGEGTVTVNYKLEHGQDFNEYIVCEPDCDTAGDVIFSSEVFDAENDRLEFVAEPAAGSIFAGWSGEGCNGTDPCLLAPDQDRTVTATFDRTTTFADLGINLKSTDTPVLQSEETPVDIEITNDGPDKAKETSIMLEMSNGQITKTPDNLDCDETPAQQVECLFGDMEAGAEEEINYVIVVEETGEVVITGTLSSTTEDPDESNNTDEITLPVEEEDSGSDACVQSFGLNGDQALGLRFMTTNISGFLGSFVDVECAGANANTLQVSETEGSTSDVDITCTDGDCGGNNIINGTELSCSLETTFGNQSFFFDCFESTQQGDKQRTLLFPIGPKPEPSTIVSGNTYTYSVPNLIVNEGLPERCGSGFNDSDVRGAGNGLDFEAANGTISGLFGGQEKAFEGPYSSITGLWEAVGTLPFGSEGEITRTIEGVFQQQLDGPILIVGEVSVEISDPGGQLDGCIYSGTGQITNRE